ncbi:hypothetical protein Mgra_00005057 [Meloidogyne graminicola]|uniref:Uncharacterized protein n=1 Tax=Meloidogyne graminicola TaxID=189291 RepID=A0A8S9ZQG0_9BILA|nr:hypothetical protein Mgra_00005057 [Meloidogyne graminicola]
MNGNFGTSSRQRKKNSEQLQGQFKKDEQRDVILQKGKQTIKEPEHISKKLSEWTTRISSLNYTNSEYESDDNSIELELNGNFKNNKVENLKKKSNINKENPNKIKLTTVKNQTGGQNEKGRNKKKMEEMLGNWRNNVKSYEEVLKEEKMKRRRRLKLLLNFLKKEPSNKDLKVLIK